MGLGGCRKQVQAHLLCRDRREDINLLVTNGLRLNKLLPGSVVFVLDGVLLYVLSIVEPLHGKRAVECDRLWKGDLDNFTVGSRRRGTEGSRVAIAARFCLSAC